MQVRWDIRREGRAWRHDEAMERYVLTPEKLEMELRQASLGR